MSSVQQNVITIQLHHNTGMLMLVDMSCEGMVGEEVTWQKAFHVPSFHCEKTPVMTPLSYRELKPILEEIIKTRINNKADPQGNGYIVATYGEKVFNYTQEKEQNYIDALKQFLYNMSPEGQKEQEENTNAEAIARVI